MFSQIAFCHLRTHFGIIHDASGEDFKSLDKIC